jgi:hypothetical protein
LVSCMINKIHAMLSSTDSYIMLDKKIHRVFDIIVFFMIVI